MRGVGGVGGLDVGNDGPLLRPTSSAERFRGELAGGVDGFEGEVRHRDGVAGRGVSRLCVRSRSGEKERAESNSGGGEKKAVQAVHSRRENHPEQVTAASMAKARGRQPDGRPGTRTGRARRSLSLRCEPAERRDRSRVERPVARGEAGRAWRRRNVCDLHNASRLRATYPTLLRFASDGTCHRRAHRPRGANCRTEPCANT